MQSARSLKNVIIYNIAFIVIVIPRMNYLVFGRTAMFELRAFFEGRFMMFGFFMGCSTFAEYAVIAEISAAKIHPGADLNQVCDNNCK